MDRGQLELAFRYYIDERFEIYFLLVVSWYIPKYNVHNLSSSMEEEKTN